MKKKDLVMIITCIVVFVILTVLYALNILKPIGLPKEEEEIIEYGKLSVDEPKYELLSEEDEQKAIEQETMGDNDFSEDEYARLEKNRCIWISDDKAEFIDFVTIERLYGIKLELYDFLKRAGYADSISYRVDYDSIVKNGGSKMALDLINMDDENLKLRIQYDKVKNQLQMALFDEKTQGYLYPAQEEQEELTLSENEIWEILGSVGEGFDSEIYDSTDDKPLVVHEDTGIMEAEPVAE